GVRGGRASFRLGHPLGRLVPARARSVRRAARRARAAELARADAPPAHRSGRARRLSGERALGPEPRRPRQPPARRLRAAPPPARGAPGRARRGRPRALGRGAPETLARVARARPAPPPAGPLRADRGVSADPGDRRARRARRRIPARWRSDRDRPAPPPPSRRRLGGNARPRAPRHVARRPHRRRRRRRRGRDGAPRRALSGLPPRARERSAMSGLRVWAPRAGAVELECAGRRRAMVAEQDGWWSAGAATPAPGVDYAFLLDGEGPLPDPRSPCQPAGVHGP